MNNYPNYPNNPPFNPNSNFGYQNYPNQEQQFYPPNQNQGNFYNTNNNYGQPQNNFFANNFSQNNFSSYGSQNGPNDFVPNNMFENSNSFNPGWGNFNNQNTNSFNGFMIPDQFQMKQKILTFGTDLKLQCNGTQFGIIKEKIFNLGSTFNLQTNNGVVIATAKQRLLTFGRDFQILDNSGKLIGSIIEEVLKSMLSIHRKYSIKDPYGNIIGTTKELQVLRSSIEVFDGGKSTAAKFQQGYIKIIRDTWKIRFFGNSIDRRLLVFFPAITSERQQEKSSNSGFD